MHKEILTPEQVQLLPLVKEFKKDFYLVGGTAIAFQLGHRRSIDFDLFTEEIFKNNKIKAKIKRNGYKIDRIVRDEEGQLTLIINKVYFTFYNYLYKVEHPSEFGNIIMMPDLLTLGAMKGFALGQRAKWKDYIDLYFIFQKYSYQKVATKANKLFNDEFNEKLLKEQLSYFDDINYRETVEFLPGFEVSESKVKKYLTEVSLER